MKVLIVFLLLINICRAGLPPLPSQANNSGKYLTTDGVKTSWAALNIPSGGAQYLGSCTATFSSNQTTTSGASSPTTYALAAASSTLSFSVTGSATFPNNNTMSCLWGSLLAGDYLVIFQGPFGATPSAQVFDFSIYDGSTNSDIVRLGTLSNTYYTHDTYVGSFKYSTTQTNKLFTVRCGTALSSTACGLAASAPLTIKLFYFP